jgi:arylsulfatase A-like enzyme
MYPYEGGIRVPLLVKWPKTVKAGATCSAPVCSIDFFPTLLEIAGLKSQGRVDGRNLAPLIESKGSLQRDALYWHYPHYCAGRVKPFGAVRAGDWKLIEFYEDQRVELYNLKQDLGESHDLTADQPARVAQLLTMLHNWRESVNAQMPTPNPKYKPAKAIPRKEKPTDLALFLRSGED